MKRTLLCISAALAVLTGAGGITPAAAGGPPASFNELFTSTPITVNGSYIPLVGRLDCESGGAAGMVWYAPGTATDHRWTNLDTNDSGQFEYSTNPISVNGTYQPFVGDFDGDECDDIFWYAPGSAADFVWYGDPTGFVSRPVTVSGTGYRPLVGDFDDTPGDDIFWYAANGGTETIWRGTATRGTFIKTTAPQVSGLDYRVASFGSGIFFHRPGPGADYIWNDVAAGASAPGESVAVAVNGTYQPVDTIGILLYGAGPAPDHLIYDYLPSGELSTIPGRINGVYRVAVPPPSMGFPMILFHAPGSAPDFLWVPGMAMAAGL